MKTKKYLLLSAITLLILASASAHAFGEVLRNTDGSIKYMSHHDARHACPDGMRLPTVRELAKISQENGATGLQEIKQGSSNPPKGYVRIYSFMPDEKLEWFQGDFYDDWKNGETDDFDFNFNGYKPLKGDLDHWFWSSAIYKPAPVYAYAYHGIDGNFYQKSRDDEAAVRCVSR